MKIRKRFHAKILQKASMLSAFLCTVLDFNNLLRLSRSKPRAFRGSQTEPAKVIVQILRAGFPALPSPGLWAAARFRRTYLGWNTTQHKPWCLPGVGASRSSCLPALLASDPLLQLARTRCYKSHVNFPVPLGLVQTETRNRVELTRFQS